MKKLGYGFMRLPLLKVNDLKSIDYSLVNECVDYFIKEGFTYFDTAYIYHEGLSEEAIKQCVVQRYPREEYTIATKMPLFLVNELSDYERIFNEQLKRCGVDFFDYYLLHSITNVRYENDLVKKDGFIFLQELKKQGLVKKIGFSFHDDAKTLAKILQEHPEVEFVQLQINYVDWDNDAIQSRLCYEVACQYHVPVIIMEPIKGGSLAKLPLEIEGLLKKDHENDSIASWALRYAGSLDNVMMILSGMSDLSQVIDNTKTMKEFKALNKQEYQILNDVKEKINNLILVQCTNCRYCLEGCPQNIPIPEYFALYNNQHQFNLAPAMYNYYYSLSENGNKASACIACQKCEQICPQHLSIIKYLKKVAEIFEQ
jgi:predicted aldo/keto reductase-like oxidoreductase